MKKTKPFPSLFYGVDQKGRLIMTHPMLDKVHVVFGVDAAFTNPKTDRGVMFISYGLKKQTGHG